MHTRASGHKNITLNPVESNHRVIVKVVSQGFSGKLKLRPSTNQRNHLFVGIHHSLSGAYELLRKSGFVQLPSQRTLRDYTHYYTTTSGFSTELNHQLVRDSAMSSLKEYQRHICLIGDEMYVHVKEDLVYSKSTGELVGFRDIGDINQYLLKLEHEAYGSQNNEERLATTMMVFMVRGLFTGFTFPYATFPATNLTGDQLIPLYLECTFRLERCGFCVTCHFRWAFCKQKVL